MFHGDAGRLNDLVLSGLKKVHIKQPGLEEKLEFVDALENLYPDAKFDPDLDKRSAASMTVHTPNRSLEQLYRSSDRTGSAIGKGELIEQKERDVEDMSEHTLLPLDASRVSRNKLVGRNIEVPIEILTQIGERLASGDSSSPQNVLLVGAPGFGKTDLALLVARRARCPAYQMISPKGGIVGETERKARMQQEALSELAPAIAFCDEITESFPMGRNKLNGDSGASAAITAQLLTSLSDESRSGKTLLVATTNFPQVLGMAMRSRFVVIPILSPLEDDYTDILVELVKRISPNSELSLDDPPVIEAASKFYQKGASPRDVRRALSDTLLFTPSGSLKAEDTLEAAEMLKMSSDRESMEYSELQAIKYCSTRRFLPWHGHRIDNYRFPAHLSGIVDRNSGEIDHVALETRLRELGSFANV
ncbi:MAG: AAA family ATPase [Aridibacter famidurans]|nr:AAA family ATPase [Aridibacter famidurans]